LSVSPEDLYRVVVDVPKTRYALAAGGVNVAYQVIGDGPMDLVFVPSAVSQIEVFWEEPAVAQYLRRLASFSRLIIFDKRGVGMSDRVEGAPMLEERMDDVRAVIDAVGVERAAILGMSEGGAIGAMFAATYPKRVTALVMLNAATRCWTDMDLSDPEVERMVGEYLTEHHGTGFSLERGAPSVADDARIRAWAGRVERLAGSPASTLAMMKLNTGFDVRSALPAVSAPTLIIHRRGDQVVNVEQGREAAALMPNARLVELEGTDHLPFFEDPDATLALIQEFVTGQRYCAEPDRVLATVMFTDIVDSTKLLIERGDREWKKILDRHDALIDRELERYRGRKVNPTGDGVLATFDGPARAVQCACAIRDGVVALGIEARAGVHTGEIELRGDDVSGVAVHLGARVAALAEPSQILVTRTVTELVAGSDLSFSEYGEHELKGLPGTWHIYAVGET
jgi:pimeloyl-ACP methyl ester carboxylesterase